MAIPDYSSEKSSASYNLSTHSSTIRPRSAQNSSSLPPPATNGENRRPGLQRKFSIAPPYNWRQVKRLLSRPLVWIIAVIVVIVWYSSDSVGDLQSPELQSRLRDLFPPQITRELRFFPASHNRIHVGISFFFDATDSTDVVLTVCWTMDYRP